MTVHGERRGLDSCAIVANMVVEENIYFSLYAVQAYSEATDKQ